LAPTTCAAASKQCVRFRTERYSTIGRLELARATEPRSRRERVKSSYVTPEHMWQGTLNGVEERQEGRRARRALAARGGADARRRREWAMVDRTTDIALI
jgi:hypothetical protein